MFNPASNRVDAQPVVDSPSVIPELIQTQSRKSRIESSQLMQGNRELLIAHAGEEYRLRLTRNDKLILTK